MQIELVDKCAVELVQHTGSDAMVAGAAWVSVSAGDALAKLRDTSNDPTKLIDFLMAKRHGTPFEHNSMTFFVDAPIFVWREFHRHRIGWSYNETSARYKQLAPRFWTVPVNRPLIPEPGYKATQPKFVPGTIEDLADVKSIQLGAYTECYDRYLKLLERGIAKEVARSVLPVAIMSQCWCTCNARSLMAFLSLRTYDNSAKFVSYPQDEIEEVARQMEKIFAELFPITHQAWDDNGRVAWDDNGRVAP